MPLYDFYCWECKHRWEAWVTLDNRGIPQSAPPKCPKCMGHDIDRVLCAPARIEVK
jgi:putative FmdB family regulatory protein